jgi:hypothetical protein
MNRVGADRIGVDVLFGGIGALLLNFFFADKHLGESASRCPAGARNVLISLNFQR